MIERYSWRTGAIVTGPPADPEESFPWDEARAAMARTGDHINHDEGDPDK